MGKNPKQNTNTNKRTVNALQLNSNHIHSFICGGKRKINLDNWKTVSEPDTRELNRSVVSDSLRPHGLQPTSLLGPWDSPGKNTGVGQHSLLQGVFRYSMTKNLYISVII